MRSSRTFSLYPLRFSFNATDPCHFPANGAANSLRGAFGSISRRLACVPDCPGFAGLPTRACPRAAECFYARVFEPPALPIGPSGFHNRPRPFVFRAAHLDGLDIAPGAPFHFDLHLFDTRPGAALAIRHLTDVFTEMSQEGWGSHRSRAKLTDVSPPELLTLELAAATDADIQRIFVEFLTPTELKSNGELTEHLAFVTLFNRIRDRLSALSTFYGEGELDFDFKALAQRASAISVENTTLMHVDRHRRSSRTGQQHSLGGFLGHAVYAGHLTEFWPWLQAAQWTGVGRQTTWGKGQILVRPPDAIPALTQPKRRYSPRATSE